MNHLMRTLEKRLLFVALNVAIWIGVTASLAAGMQQATPTEGRPAWVVDGVSDSVWVLVEAATSTNDDDRARRLLEEAEIHARHQIEGHEEDVGRRFGLVVVLGLRANREGGRQQVRAAAELHKELDVLLELDPNHARARHLLGRVHAGVRRMNRVTRWMATNLLGGGELKKATWEEAERNLAFAVEHAPEVSDHHLQLANLYLDTDRPQLAVVELEHVLTMPATSPLEQAVLEEALGLMDSLGPRHRVALVHGSRL